MDISIDLINEFREKVNDNSYFVLHKYGEKEGKNLWNCVCSCMDWIELSIQHIIETKDKVKNKDYFDMTVYSYISSIDNILEAINQLHRILVNSGTTPFKDEYKIFCENNLQYSDDKYFKHIRAIFGAHPVNLTSNKEKWFASYPTRDYCLGYDYVVSLWTNKMDGEDVIFGFKIEELNYFLLLRYNYLKVLMKKIDDEFEKFECRMKEIEIPKGIDNKEWLQNLKVASKERLDNDYYRETIDNLIYLFNVKSTKTNNKKIIKDYLQVAEKLISELHLKLQNMNFEELENDIFDARRPETIRYELSKFHDQVIYNRSENSSFQSYFLDFNVKRIKDYFKDVIVINEEMEMEELSLLIRAAQHFHFDKN